MDPNWTDVVTVVLVALQLVVLVVAAVIGFGQVSEARRLRLEQNRPFVVVDFELEATPFIDLVVTNVGPSLARDVWFKIDPPLVSAADGDLDLYMLTKGIPTLPPGKVLRTFFDSFIERQEAAEDLPDIYTVRVMYTDETGDRDFSEIYVLDLGIYKNLTYLVRHNLHDVHKRLEDMVKEIKKWTSKSGPGIIAASPEEARTEAERRRQIGNENRARIAAAEAAREAKEQPPEARS